MSSGDRKEKRKKRQDEGFARIGSGVDYSKVADRHVDDARYEKHQKAGVGTTAATTLQQQQEKKMSSKMEAVYRLMAGKDERTIAEKLADSNRPTWEQYKKDNEDKLNLEGVDQQKMEEYRRELDLERERRLARGINHKDEKKKKKSRKKKRKHYHSDESDSDSDDSRGKRHKRKRDRKRKKHHRRHSDSEEDSESSTSGSKDDSKKRKRHQKKKKKHKKSEKQVDERYRLSNFFTKESDEE